VAATLKTHLLKGYGGLRNLLVLLNVQLPKLSPHQATPHLHTRNITNGDIVQELNLYLFCAGSFGRKILSPLRVA
jgi:hypothetical protein